MCKQLDFSYRPISFDDTQQRDQFFDLSNQMNKSIDFLATAVEPILSTSTKQHSLHSLPAVMFIYNISPAHDEDEYSYRRNVLEDDESSYTSTSEDEEDVVMGDAENSRTANDSRRSITGIINFDLKEITIYPPSNLSDLNKNSIINIMDIAEVIGLTKMYIYLEKNHSEVKEFAKGFRYAGFEVVSPSVKHLNANEWLLFGSEL
ncbi:hypothetical protein ABK040_005671 [Willaertia magna]